MIRCTTIELATHVMARHSLPSHLAHKSALAFVLTEDDSAYACVQAIRQAHDRSFDRWPPHINLVYPFLATPSANIDDILARVAIAVHDVPAVSATFPAVQHFTHSKKSATLFLEPDAVSTRPQLQSIQAALQAAFPECNHDTRPFVPHLSLGQTAGGASGIKALTHQMESSLREACSSPPDKGCDFFDDMAAAAMTSNAHVDPFVDEPAAWTLPWTIGRVVVLERRGFDDPFEIVGQIALK
ncbi:hypothetical protein DYB25_001346 [Aphanomyces astaci]|uniref:Uncharacterized protein n=1 Tax=Aphanomyces astaci TaxID=112090 RepID=A0A397C4B4_APHAT|nr:hypothetical protein DYB25_001346 [Aphanomyces astaci]